jgi:hypothetical protein
MNAPFVKENVNIFILFLSIHKEPELLQKSPATLREVNDIKLLQVIAGGGGSPNGKHALPPV